MIAPGISWTAIPGCRSSGGRPGWTRTVPLVEPRSVTTAEPWSAPGARPDLQVGRGDLLVGAGHGHQPRLLGRGEAPGLRGAADEHGPVDLDGLAAGEHQPGDRAGDHARRRRLPGDAGRLAYDGRVPAAGPGHPVVVVVAGAASAGASGGAGGAGGAIGASAWRGPRSSAPASAARAPASGRRAPARASGSGAGSARRRGVAGSSPPVPGSARGGVRGGASTRETRTRPFVDGAGRRRRSASSTSTVMRA